jgi:HEAT repeat protein
MGLALAGCSQPSPTRPPEHAPHRPDPTAASAAAPGSNVLPVAVVEEWTRQLADADSQVRQRALESAAAAGEPGFPVLLEGLHNPLPEVRLHALRVMHKSVMEEHADEILPVVSRLLVDPHPQVRQEMVGRINWLGDDGVASLLPRLREIAQADADAGVRLLAAQAIVNLNGTVPGLLGLLRDFNPLIRRQAALQLGGLETDGQQALPHLRALAASDPSPEVRAAALETIAALTGESRE